MKILAVETHYKVPYKNNVRRTSAVDWWRIVNPFSHLKKNTSWDIEIKKGVLSRDDFKLGDPEADLEWERVGKTYDLIWFSYIENPIAYSYLAILSQKYGLKFVLDLDDNMLSPSLNHPYFTDLLSKNRAYEDFKKIIYFSPYLSVTNGYLKKIYKNFKKGNGEIFVLPNFIDFEVYKAKEHIEDGVITIGWQGGINHYNDFFLSPFSTAISYILGKYKDKVKFEIIGFFEENHFKGLLNYRWYEGSSDFYEWVKIWQERTRYWDIAVCPLINDEFNMGKSPIKTYEAVANKIPVVVSDVGPYKYIVNDKTGYKCTTTADWIRALEILIENEDKRRKLGENLYQEVAENYTIQNNWWRWREVILKIL